MTEDPQLLQVLAGLRAQYLAEAPGRIADLRAVLTRLGQGDPNAAGELRQLLHRLAGSGGAYGLHAVTDCARAGEMAIRAILERGSAPTEAELAALAGHVAAVEAAFRGPGAAT